MSVFLMFDPIQLIIFKSFSNTFSYYPELNFLISDNKDYIEKWISWLFPNFKYNLIEVESYKQLKKNDFYEYNFNNIIDKIINKKINYKTNNNFIKEQLLLSFSIQNLQDYNNYVKNQNYHTIILNDNLDKKKIEFLIKSILLNKNSIKKIVFIGYHKNEYLKWINDLNSKNYIYLANIQKDNFFDSNVWIDFLHILNQSNLKISYNIDYFSFFIFLLSPIVKIQLINEIQDLDFNNFIYEKSTIFVEQNTNYNKDIFSFYKNNLHHLFQYFKDPNKIIKKSIIEEENKIKKSVKFKSNDLIENKDKDDYENKTILENNNLKFPFEEKYLIIKISDTLEYDLLFWTYIFILYDEDLKNKKIYIDLKNISTKIISTYSNYFLSSWLKKMSVYLKIYIYESNQKNHNYIILDKNMILPHTQNIINLDIKNKFLKYLNIQKKIVYDLNYAILNENILHIHEESKYKKYIILKNSVQNNVLDHWKKNNHIIDFDFIEKYRESIPESDFDILERDINFILHCKKYVGFDLTKFNSRNSFLIFILNSFIQ